MIGAETHNRAGRKHGGDRGDRGFVIRRAVERHHHRGIADVEVHIGGGDDLAVALDRAGGGDRHHREPERLGARPGVGEDGRVGIVGAGGFGDSDHALADEAGEIVDMAVGMIVGEPVAEPQ